MTIKIATVTRIARARNLDDAPGLQHREIAFAGRSNVGKSSLINSLLGRKGLVRTSNTPGCTRTIDFYEIDFVGGKKINFIDLPGYGYAQRSKLERQNWQTLIEGYFENRKKFCTAVLVIDSRRGIVDDDKQLLEYFASIDVRCIIAATKIDKFKASAQPLELKKLRAAHKALHISARDLVGYSSITHHGRDELWDAISRHAKLDAST